MSVLINYCLSKMERNRHVKRVIGVCTDGPDKYGAYIGRTFDTFYYEAGDWTDDMIYATKQLELEGKKRGFNTNINFENMKTSHFDNMTDDPAREYHFKKLLNQMRNN